MALGGGGVPRSEGNEVFESIIPISLEREIKMRWKRHKREGEKTVRWAP